MTLALCAATAGVAQAATERASVSGGGSVANGASQRTTISGNGRFVAFESGASNLVAADTNGEVGTGNDIFVRDRQTGTTERVSVADDESQAVTGGLGSLHPSISADGRYVAFQSDAANLVGGDGNGLIDIFVRDRQLGTTRRIAAAENSGGAFIPSISDDGRFVAYQSANPGNGRHEIHVYDLQDSVAQVVGAGNGDAYGAAISSGGRYVAFSSTSSDLVSGDAGTDWDAFVYDREAAPASAIDRVSVSSDEAEPTSFGDNVRPAVSSDGRYVAFASRYTGLVAGAGDPSVGHVYVRDRTAGTTYLADVTAGGAPASGGAGPTVDISPNGRYIGFSSRAADLVAGDGGSTSDAFVRDQTAAATARFSVSQEGGAGNADSFNTTVSDDGTAAAFDSSSTNLTPEDSGANVPGSFVRVPIPAGGATVTIRKDALPNSPQDFSFTTAGSGLPGSFSLDDDPGDATLGSQRTFDISAAQLGAKTVTEGAATGWGLTGVTCTGDPDHSVALPTATLDVDAGERITCTFTNDQEPQADLWVSDMTIANQTEGGTLSLELYAGSHGPEVADNASWTLDGSNIEVQSFTDGQAADCTQQGASDLACDLGDLADGDYGQVNVTYAFPAAGPASLTSTITSDAVDPLPADSSDTAAFDVTGPSDTDPPTATITDKPKKKVKSKRKKVEVEFGFEADEPGSAFECELDGGGFSDCDSPASYEVKRGEHTFSVRATDPAANTGDAASYAFKVVKK